MEEEKMKIAMVKYNLQGKPVDAAYGEYKPFDVELFRKGGFVDVEERLARQISEELAKSGVPPWER